METKRIGFIGGGRITKIFLQVFANRGLSFEKIVVCDPNQVALDGLKIINSSITMVTDDMSAIADCDVIFVATHPPMVLDVLTKLRLDLSEQAMLVSLAPKIMIDQMKAALGGHVNIARVNPSAPGIINQGINPVAFDVEMSVEKQNELLELLSVLGKTIPVRESKIEAYAVISAMGSTYFWFQLKQLYDLALSYGMEQDEAKEVISGMLMGTANTLFSSGLSATEVMDLVPVHPLGEFEEIIKAFYIDKLNGIYAKIKS